MTARKIHRIDDFESLVRASSHLSILDLRARIAGRLALRAADIGHVDFAISCIEDIELEKLRWLEMIELAIRFASSGRFDAARTTASRIIAREQKSKAFAMIALELAAQGDSKAAQEILDTDICLPHWKDWFINIVGTQNLTQVSSLNADIIKERRQFRRKTDALAGANVQISAAFEALILEGILGGLYCSFPKGSEGVSPEYAISLAKKFWRDHEQGAEVVFDQLARQRRDKALNCIAKLAPIIYFSEGVDVIVACAHAIKDVSVEWP